MLSLVGVGISYAIGAQVFGRLRAKDAGANHFLGAYTTSPFLYAMSIK